MKTFYYLGMEILVKLIFRICQTETDRDRDRERERERDRQTMQFHAVLQLKSAAQICH